MAIEQKLWDSWKLAKNRVRGHTAPLHSKRDGKKIQKENKDYRLDSNLT